MQIQQLLGLSLSVRCLAKILSGCEINSFEQFPQAQLRYNRLPCSGSSRSFSEPSFAFCAVDKTLLLENLVLRQQVSVLKRKNPDSS